MIKPFEISVVALLLLAAVSFTALKLTDIRISGERGRRPVSCCYECNTRKVCERLTGQTEEPLDIHAVPGGESEYNHPSK